MQRFCKWGYVPVLIPYMESFDSQIKLLAVAALANIVDDKTIENLCADESVLRFLIEILGNALKDEEGRSFGWSTTELARSTYILPVL